MHHGQSTCQPVKMPKPILEALYLDACTLGPWTAGVSFHLRRGEVFHPKQRKSYHTQPSKDRTISIGIPVNQTSEKRDDFIRTCCCICVWRRPPGAIFGMGLKSALYRRMMRLLMFRRFGWVSGNGHEADTSG